MKILKNMTKKKIIILSVAAFLLLCCLVFLCALRTQKIAVYKVAEDNSFNKIIVNADCDINIFSGETDTVTAYLTGESKQFFKKPSYEVGLRVEDGSLIIDASNSSAYFLKDIRYEIKLQIILPQNASSDYDITLNAGQGIFVVGGVDVSSISAKNLKGKFTLVSSNVGSFQIDGFSGYMFSENSNVGNFDIKNMRTGQVGIVGLKTSNLNVDLLDGIIYMFDLKGQGDSLAASISSRKGSCLITMDSVPSLNMEINTDESHTSVTLSGVGEIDPDLSSKKGTVENNFATNEESDIKIKIHSKKGNIVLKNA